VLQMGYRRRIYLAEKQKAEIWDRWQRGGSMCSIGRRLYRNSSLVYPLLARTDESFRVAASARKFWSRRVQASRGGVEPQ